MNIEIIIKSQLEIVSQGKSFIKKTPTKLYRTIVSPHFSSSPGKHIRHILDHYFALINGLQSGLIDYNKRERDSIIELEPKMALAKIEEIEAWLSSIKKGDLHLELNVISEISLTDTINQSCKSNLARELIFVASHAVHHFSLMSAMASLQGEKVIEEFGVAPATLSYQRNQEPLLNN